MCVDGDGGSIEDTARLKDLGLIPLAGNRLSPSGPIRTHDGSTGFSAKAVNPGIRRLLKVISKAMGGWRRSGKVAIRAGWRPESSHRSALSSQVGSAVLPPNTERSAQPTPRRAATAGESRYVTEPATWGGLIGWQRGFLPKLVLMQGQRVPVGAGGLIGPIGTQPRLVKFRVRSQHGFPFSSQSLIK